MFRAASFMPWRLAGCVMGTGQVRQPRRGARLTPRRCAAGGLLAAALLAPLPALAQSQNSALARTSIVDAITVQNDADMDFGDIIVGSTAGTVVMTASAAPTCTASASLVRSGPCKAAEFSGIAISGATLRVRRPDLDSITLTGPAGATMTVTNFSFGSTGTTLYQGNPGNSPQHRFRINAANGAYTFHVGGRLNVGANQRPGIYNGTFQIDLTYN